ncbi:ankyrin repeat-containing protein [Colletotrichum musicola]|uniref:Ankyrin repeat-containing protein n=1 Tax=Colletotrichum musicola TaxID=2175873 RepID=A0A8H6NAV8_9PEZI|nr:ankyrin repeat-containing protein [Colletotrichum musicola]
MSDLLGWFRRRWLGETEANLPDVENQVHEQPATFPNQDANDYHEHGNQHRNGCHNGRNGSQSNENPINYRTDHRHSSRNDIHGNFRNDPHNRNEYLNDHPSEHHRERRDNYHNRHHDEYHNHPRSQYGNNDRDGRRDDRYDENRHQYRNTYRINSGNNPRNNFDNDRRNGRLDDYRERNENRHAYPRNHRDDYPHPQSESEQSDSSEDDFKTNDGNDDDFRGRTYDEISDDDSDITYVGRRSFDDTLIPEYGSSGPSGSSDSSVSSQPSGSSYPPGFNLTPDFRYAAGPSDASANTTDDESVHTVVESGPAHNSNISLEQPPIGPEVPASERSSRRSACHTPRIQRAREDVPRRGSHRRNRSPEPPKKSFSRKTNLYVLGEGYAAQLLRKAAKAGNAAEVRSILANAPKHYMQSPAFTKGAVLACVAKPKYGTYKSLEALVASMKKSQLNNIRDRGKTPLFLLISEPSRESFGKYHSKSLRVLLEAGAKADEMNGAENQTALHLAVAKRLPGAVKILVDYRASPDIPDGNGKTARELADHKVKALNGHENFQEAQDWTKIQEVFDGVGHRH